jgi:hypothetical protein
MQYVYRLTNRIEDSMLTSLQWVNARRCSVTIEGHHGHHHQSTIGEMSDKDVRLSM